MKRVAVIVVILAEICTDLTCISTSTWLTYLTQNLFLSFFASYKSKFAARGILTAFDIPQQHFQAKNIPILTSTMKNMEFCLLNKRLFNETRKNGSTEFRLNCCEIIYFIKSKISISSREDEEKKIIKRKRRKGRVFWKKFVVFVQPFQSTEYYSPSAPCAWINSILFGGLINYGTRFHWQTSNQRQEKTRNRKI